MSEAARTKEELADLINVGIEELVRQKYELPVFDTLVRAARHTRAVLYRQFYQQVETALSSGEKACLETLFVAAPETRFTPWNRLKQEPGSPTLTQLKVWLDRQAWLAQYPVAEAVLRGIPPVKVKHFAAEARTLDAARMLEMEPRKRWTLAACLLRVQSARVLDDLAEMLLKRLSAMHQKAKEALADYQARNQQRAEELIQTLCDAYGDLVGLPVEGPALVAHLKARLTAVAQATDHDFPDNTELRFEQGKPVLRRPEKGKPPPGLRAFELLVADRLEPTHLLGVLRDTEHWLHWTRFFGPISGHDAKLAEPLPRYLTTTFCYGCQLGPSQTARALGNVDRRQLAWIHGRHITEAGLDRAIREVINAYHRFALPKRWGTGQSAAADGTKWDLYERNLLSEYHLRYGGYGGIGYYHVSDTYIALFSHFIPCGVWEAVYLLDGLLQNLSDIQPDQIHGDTQAQSTPVFGLATLLGIRLMPRIRNWKDLTLYRPDRETSFAHLEPLFSATVDWNLIQTHVRDLLRVARSIKAGRITAAMLLRKLGTYSRKNRLYQAFRELGRAVRTEFLLQYLGSAELRALIQAATNKSEAFNGLRSGSPSGATARSRPMTATSNGS